HPVLGVGVRPVEAPFTLPVASEQAERSPLEAARHRLCRRFHRGSPPAQGRAAHAEPAESPWGRARSHWLCERTARGLRTWATSDRRSGRTTAVGDHCLWW